VSVLFYGFVQVVLSYLFFLRAVSDKNLVRHRRFARCAGNAPVMMSLKFLPHAVKKA
jgi:hypothetical protein